MINMHRFAPTQKYHILSHKLAIMATRKQAKENMCIAIYIYIDIILISQ